MFHQERVEEVSEILTGMILGEHRFMALTGAEVTAPIIYWALQKLVEKNVISSVAEGYQHWLFDINGVVGAAATKVKRDGVYNVEIVRVKNAREKNIRTCILQVELNISWTIREEGIEDMPSIRETAEKIARQASRLKPKDVYKDRVSGYFLMYGGPHWVAQALKKYGEVKEVSAEVKPLELVEEVDELLYWCETHEPPEHGAIGVRPDKLYLFSIMRAAKKE